MKKLKKTLYTLFLAFTITTAPLAQAGCTLLSNPVQVEAASKIKLNKTKLTLSVGKTYQLKLKGTKKKVTWKSSSPSIVKVSKKGKIAAKKAGTANIKAKAGKKTYTCRVTVENSIKLSPEKEDVLKLINKERTANGLSPLKMDNAALNAAADIRAKEIAEYFSHERPNGESCFTILNEKNIAYWSCGENIAAGQPDASSVMNSWMNSPGHKANILNSGYDTVGVGYYYDASKPYKYYWVQLFIQSSNGY